MAAVAETTSEHSPLREISPPWGPQSDFIRSGAVFKKYQGGQGSGKTVAGVFEVRRYVKRHADAVFICTEPTYPMVRDILKREFDRQFKCADETDYTHWIASENKYVLKNGSEIWLRQCDREDALRGPSVAGVWMDEAAQSPFGAFRILVGRVRQPDYPPLFMVTGTPRGRNWFYWVFEPGDRPSQAPPYLQDILEQEMPELVGKGSVASFTAAAIDNPYLPPMTRANLIAAYPAGTLQHQQEVLGLAVVFEGLVYKQFDPDRHIDTLPGKPVAVACGVDMGWTNPGVMLAIGLYADGRMAVLDEVYDTEKDIDWWISAGQRLISVHRIKAFYVDPSSPADINRMIANKIPAEPALNAVIPGITMVASAFAEGRLYIAPECVNTISELHAYSWKERHGEVRADEPEKVGDHAMDALRYGIMGLAIPKPQRARLQLVDPVRI
jgi:PBSX family phage terminase large subunit